MNTRKVYFGVSGEGELTRELSHGYQSIIMDENLGMGNLIDFTTYANALILSPVDGKADLSKDAITFICDSFGVCDIPSKISVIFCDDGKMIVTLYSGMLHINFGGKVVSPMCGIDPDTRMKSGVKWVDMDTLLAMKSYFGSDLQQKYYQDFEYFFEVNGTTDKSNCTTWRCKCLRDDYVDLSLGFIAETEEKIMRRNQQKQVNKLCALFNQEDTSSMTLAGGDDEDEDGLEILEDIY